MSFRYEYLRRNSTNGNEPNPMYSPPFSAADEIPVSQSTQHDTFTQERPGFSRYENDSYPIAAPPGTRRRGPDPRREDARYTTTAAATRPRFGATPDLSLQEDLSVPTLHLGPPQRPPHHAPPPMDYPSSAARNPSRSLIRRHSNEWNSDCYATPRENRVPKPLPRGGDKYYKSSRSPESSSGREYWNHDEDRRLAALVAENMTWEDIDAEYDFNRGTAQSRWDLIQDQYQDERRRRW